MCSWLFLIIFLTHVEGLAMISQQSSNNSRGHIMLVEEIGLVPTQDGGFDLALAGKNFTVIAHQDALKTKLLTHVLTRPDDGLKIVTQSKMDHIKKDTADARANSEANYRQGYTDGKLAAELVAREDNLSFQYNMGLKEGHEDGVEDGIEAGRAKVISEMLASIQNLFVDRYDGKNSPTHILNPLATPGLEDVKRFVQSFNREVKSPAPFNAESPYTDDLMKKILATERSTGNKAAELAMGYGGQPEGKVEGVFTAIFPDHDGQIRNEMGYGGQPEGKMTQGPGVLNDIRAAVEAYAAGLGGKVIELGPDMFGIEIRPEIGHLHNPSMNKSLKEFGERLRSILTTDDPKKVEGSVTGRLGGSHPSESLLKKPSKVKSTSFDLVNEAIKRAGPYRSTKPPGFA